MRRAKNHYLPLLVAITLSLFGGAGLAADQQAPADKEKQVDALFAGIAGLDAPGASVLVARDGQVLLEKSYGYANVEHHVLNTPQTKLRLASMTKSFTALAILQLAEAGKLSLDDHLATYLPRIPASDTITLRQLLSHTSGLSNEDEPPAFPPGTRIEYSNTGYFVLGKVIEKVSGQSYEEYLRQHVFAPLGMSDTGMDHPEALLPHRASGYVWDTEAKHYLNAPFEDATGAGSAGGLYSTVEDLYRLTQALAKGTLLKPETVTLAFSRAKIADGSEVNYGFGWAVETNRGLREVNHGGDITGFNSQLSLFPEQHFTVIVLSNVLMRPASPLPSARTLAHAIAAIYLGDAMGSEPAPFTVRLSPEQLQAFAGTYRMTGRKEVLDVCGDLLTIEVVDGHLVGSDRVNRADLVAESDTAFALGTDNATKVLFHRGENGVVSGVTVRLMGLVEMQGTRLPEP